MGLFNKKKTNEFKATKTFMVDRLQYDEKQNLIRLKNGFQVNVIPIDNIQTYSLKFGNKTYYKVNLGKAFVGGATLGLVGVILAGTHKEEYVSNITVSIKANDKFYFLPLTIGKIKYDVAKGILQSAEGMIKFLDEVTNK